MIFLRTTSILRKNVSFGKLELILSIFLVVNCFAILIKFQHCLQQLHTQKAKKCSQLIGGKKCDEEISQIFLELGTQMRFTHLKFMTMHVNIFRIISLMIDKLSKVYLRVNQIYHLDHTSILSYKCISIRKEKTSQKSFLCIYT